MEQGKRILELTVRAGELLLRSGGEIFRVQETMIRIAKAYGAPSLHVFVISNGLFVTLDEGNDIHSTEIRFVPLSPVHLGRVAAVNSLSRAIEAGQYTLDEAFAQLDTISALPYAKPSWTLMAYAIGCGSFCYLLGGNIIDSLTAFLSGILLYLFSHLAGKKNLSKIIQNILGSALVTLCGLLFFHFGMGDHMDKIIIGSIIPLVPGVALTTSIRDFLNSDYLSGSIRLIDALLIAACIALGVGATLKISGFLVGGIL